MDRETLLADAARVSSIADLAGLLRRLRHRQARRLRAPVVTYRELATRTGWSHGIIGAYLTGKVLPPVDRFDELARQLDATAAELGALATARDRVGEHRPVSSPAIPPRHLPAGVAGFTGRAAALAVIGSQPGRPVVICGGAGLGKTALAVHWAHGAAADFPDGQLFADLNGHSANPRGQADSFGHSAGLWGQADSYGRGVGLQGQVDPYGRPAELHGYAAGRRAAAPAAVLDGFLTALGVPERGIPAALEAKVGLYRSLLADRRILVVLDDALDAAQVRPLLPGTPGCLALITSRSRLSGLVAVEAAAPVVLERLPPAQARELLAARLGARRLIGDPAGTDAVVAACAGVPLALAMAAARAATRPELTLSTVARELAAARPIAPAVPLRAGAA